MIGKGRDWFCQAGVIARSEATKQSSRRLRTGLLRSARNDELPHPEAAAKRSSKDEAEAPEQHPSRLAFGEHLRMRDDGEIQEGVGTALRAFARLTLAGLFHERRFRKLRHNFICVADQL